MANKSSSAEKIDAAFALTGNAGQGISDSAEKSANAPIKHEPPKSIGVSTSVQAATAPKHTILSLNGTRFRLRQAGDLHNIWDASIERTHKLQDLLYPEYFKHVAMNIRPHDEIIAIEESGAFRAHLFVLGCDRLWAKCFVLEAHDLTASTVNMPKSMEEEYEVTWTSIGKFALNKKGMEGLPALKDGFNTRLEAYQWLDGHLKTLNAR